VSRRDRRPDDEVCNTVDALFTAVTGHNNKLLDDCERRLLKLRNEARPSAGASGYLADIINRARAGGWEPAAHVLYDFVRGQKHRSARPHGAGR